MASQKTERLVADHKRGWHKNRDFGSLGCPLCQRRRA